MPYENEHSCDFGGTYKKYRRVNCDQKHDGKCIDVVYGINDPGESKISSLRYKKDVWTKDAAKAHCKSRKGTFEAAAESKSDDERELRTVTFTEIETEKRDDGQRMLAGHAAVFDEIGDGIWFKEKIDKGAFKKTIKSDDIRALFNHDPNLILGRNTADTLQLRNDEKGLAVKIYPPDTQYARDLIVSVERGDITQMSFAFTVEKQDWEEEKGKVPLRILREVKLYDVSPVTFPFYEGTDVAVRSYNQFLEGRETNNDGVNRKAFYKRRLALLRLQEEIE